MFQTMSHSVEEKPREIFGLFYLCNQKTVWPSAVIEAPVAMSDIPKGQYFPAMTF